MNVQKGAERKTTKATNKCTVNKQISLRQLDSERNTKQKSEREIVLKVEARDDPLSLLCYVTLSSSGLMLQAITFDVMCCHQHFC